MMIEYSGFLDPKPKGSLQPNWLCSFDLVNATEAVIKNEITDKGSHLAFFVSTSSPLCPS